jgi:type IV fimbrial biogenesis protein FimT
MKVSKSFHFQGNILKGFTLVEMMVALSLVGILSMIAVPSFRDYLRNAEVGEVVNQFTEPLATARNKISSTVPLAVAIPNGANQKWEDGWIIFLDKNNNFSIDADEEIILNRGQLPSYIKINATGTAAGDGGKTHLSFSQYNSVNMAGGFGASTIEFKRNDIASEHNIRRIKIAGTGRVRVCKPAGDTTCTFD